MSGLGPRWRKACCVAQAFGGDGHSPNCPTRTVRVRVPDRIVQTARGLLRQIQGDVRRHLADAGIQDPDVAYLVGLHRGLTVGTRAPDDAVALRMVLERGLAERLGIPPEAVEAAALDWLPAWAPADDGAS